MNGWTDGRTDGWMHACIHACIHRCMHACMDSCIDGRMDGWMDWCSLDFLACFPSYILFWDKGSTEKKTMHWNFCCVTYSLIRSVKLSKTPAGKLWIAFSLNSLPKEKQYFHLWMFEMQKVDSNSLWQRVKNGVDFSVDVVKRPWLNINIPFYCSFNFLSDCTNAEFDKKGEAEVSYLI